MSELILSALGDGLKDALLSAPVLFIAYLLMELLERSRRLDEAALHRGSRRAGPLIGGLLGVVPQCGIAGAAATLFSTGTVSVGTMTAVFLATSDEMLPIMAAALTSGDHAVSAGFILKIVAAKAAAGIVFGYLTDVLFGRLFSRPKNIRSFCESEHCEEKDHPAAAALKHTAKIALMLFAVNVALDLIFSALDIHALPVTAGPAAGALAASLFGLIPNCSVSVILTGSYLAGLLPLEGLFAGLLSNAGIGLIVLFRTNKNMREDLSICALLYAFGVVGGLALGALF